MADRTRRGHASASLVALSLPPPRKAPGGLRPLPGPSGLFRRRAPPPDTKRHLGATRCRFREGIPTNPSETARSQ